MQCCPQRRRVKKKKRRPPQNESESEQEEKKQRKLSKHRRPRLMEFRKGQELTSSVQNTNTAEKDSIDKDRKCHVAHTINKDASVTSEDNEEKLELQLPETTEFREENTKYKYETIGLEDLKMSVTKKPRSVRTDCHHNARIQAEEESIQAIQHRLAKALIERICHSEVELSDSSDSTDIQSITEETWTPKIIPNGKMAQPKLTQQVAAKKKGNDNRSEDARSELVMSSNGKSMLQEPNQEVAEERQLEANAGEDARSGAVMSSNQESTLQEPNQQMAAERQMEKEKSEGINLGSALSSSGKSNICTRLLGKGDEVDDGDIHEIADEDGLLSQISDLITVLQESDEVEQLVLRNTGMTYSLLHRLVPGIIVSKSEVECINLNLNEIGPGGAENLLQLLREKPCIQSLLLYGNNLEDKGIKTLLCGLSEILITQRRTDTTLSYKTPLVQLSELDIGGNHISDDALKSVADYLRLNPLLKHLGLAHISVQAAAAWQELFDALKINTNLHHILLDENGLGDTGARLIAEVIKVNKSLVTIDLDSNDIGEEGGKAIIECLLSTSNMVLTTISLDNNNISGGTRAAIHRLIMTKLTDQ
ncbi:uncharacterized protein [Pyxicephalus adspersus]|uniref:uncharacterized protein n=1 Tax=Pyxicephalus adspersus TaxID=30357 RepID=UPI003B59444D